ncbi:MAG: YheC/YheD family protein [Myxococcota bacterium]
MNSSTPDSATSNCSVGVLAPRVRNAPGHPADFPIGRAALALEADGVAVVIGDTVKDGTLVGVRAHPDGWQAAALAVSGIYDRFPSRSRHAEHTTLRNGLRGLRWVNDPRLVDLCADKVGSQAWLAERVPMPEIETDPTRFADCLNAWGAAFAKPRFGAFGAGIERVTPGMQVAPRRISSVKEVHEPTILQRAVAAPSGFAGIALRILVQRTVEGPWWAGPAVVRHHRADPVVNAARGAHVTDAAGCAEVDEPAAQALAVLVAERLAEAPGGEGLVEIGVDLVVDDNRVPHVIEVNSRPRGRLEVLATQDPARYRTLHLEACARPLRWLAARADDGTSAGRVDGRIK